MRVKRTSNRAALLALLLFAAQFGARIAHADEDDVTVSLSRLALKGQGKPTITAQIHKPIAGLSLELTRSDGHMVKATTGKLGAGATREFPLDQPEGTFHYEGKLVAKFAKGPPQEMPMVFDASLYGPLQISVTDQAVDLAAHTVTLTADRAVAQLHVRVQADDGHVIAEYDEKFPSAKANEPVTTTWHPESDGSVLSIHVRATDTFGVYREIDLFPWKFEIPHEDVLFENGKADILDTEKPKLEAAYSELAKAIEKYGRFAKVQLFIAGYTDTVGDAASNKALSEARALSIARYFRAHGARLPIHFAGFGEAGLLVPTPDETPEPKNRRAAYVVSVQAPSGVHWSQLK